MEVTHAVVPVAGLGTRLLPATRSQPKEMLPVAGRPVVQHVVEELAGCGISRVLLVTGRSKRAIEDHFDARPPLPSIEGVALAATRQPEPLGLGDAVLCAEGFCGSAPFAVALGDAIIGRHRPSDIVARLSGALAAHGAAAAVAVTEVPREQTGRYGIAVPDGPAGADGVLALRAIVEKPDPASAPSTLAIAARYVLSPAIFDALRATPPGVGGEVQLTDAIAALLAGGAPVVAVPLRPDEPRFDIGNQESYARTFVEFALTDPELGPAMRARARELLAQDDG